MRRLFVVCALMLSIAAGANAASIEESRIAAIDQAAKDFLARVAGARKSGGMPRQSDPAIGALLDTVLDTSDLSHGPVPYDDLERLYRWLNQIAAIDIAYITAGSAAHDIGIFSPEIGRSSDAEVAVAQAFADCMMAELDTHPGATMSPADQHKLVQLREKIAGVFNSLIELLHTPGLTIGWSVERLAALRAAAPSMAHFLTPAQVARLRATILRLNGAVRQRAMRVSLGSLADALANPAPPAGPPQAAPTDAEIALETDAQGYTVPVRINGATTVKFIIDSGASVVVLPKDLVETLTKSGAIVAADVLGRDTYVTADGRRHHGTRLMLRQLDVGGHTVTNVAASVAPEHVEPLLGQSFLTKFRSWTLDNRRHVLIIAE
jgi:clan AA aspartic protease (TIGR02281 family)